MKSHRFDHNNTKTNGTIEVYMLKKKRIILKEPFAICAAYVPETTLTPLMK